MKGMLLSAFSINTARNVQFQRRMSRAGERRGDRQNGITHGERGADTDTVTKTTTT